ncbi:uncharacterized protein LOC129270950 [Lytechinus pictus]|uniref:uncharacterized protein LOC129270950 n=1 Tax=Lytechinus pictus TaxID=7653 RepID=UPI0030B9C143
MPEAELIVANSIKVLTQNGECRVDLCLGDITRLPKKDAVDVIVISAFRGDYSPSPKSVIGALQRTFNISVENLAKDKEEDLRKLYSCWWSKPLPSKLPYRRLLCFETRRVMDGRPQELVANVFRCLVPILNNEDGTVITPLLNAQQGADEVAMLKGMVEAAVNWMKAGLPLRQMKLVLYAQVKDGEVKGHSLKRFEDVMQTFDDLKERYEMQLLLPKAVPLEFDVYLSFSKEDEEVANVIREKLSSAKDGILIYDSSQQAMNTDSVFQQDMYSVMMKSARVVTVLSPHYLKNDACIEQYNIALCCNRRALRDMLAPFYVDSMELMPTYMGLVQYVDCRPHDPSKIQVACSELSVSLSVSVHAELTVAEFDPLHYDVFLSYSHRDTEKANCFVDMLQHLAPNLKIFFDVQELKAGKSWQRTLYHSIDGSRCMLALISEPYLKSAVCQEEFALAQAKHFQKGKQHLQLIPICLEDLDAVPQAFTHIPMVKGTLDVFEDTVNTVCPAVVHWLTGGKVDSSEALTKLFDEENIPCASADDEMRSFHQASIQEEFGTSDILLDPGVHFPPALSNVLQHSDSDTKIGESEAASATNYDVVISYHSEDQKFVDFICKLLESNAPNLAVKSVAGNKQDNLASLDKADCILPILSPSYIESPECVEEFHVAIWRQRVADPDTPLMLPVQVHNLPQKPTYFHLVHYIVNTTDGVWAQLTGQHKVSLPNDVEHLRTGDGTSQVSRSDALALVMAVYKILHRYAQAKNASVDTETSPRPALFNVMKLGEQIKQLTDPDYKETSQLILLDADPSDIPSSWREVRQDTGDEEGEGSHSPGRLCTRMYKKSSLCELL